LKSLCSSKKIVPIEGTPDSFLMTGAFQIPKFLMEHLDHLFDLDLLDSTHTSKPHVSFYSEIDHETNSLAYLRCPSIKTVEEFTLPLRDIAHEIDPEVNIIKVVRYENGSKSMKAHADKTIDLDENIPIYNIRLGAPRKFVLQHKTNGTVITTVVPHGGVFILGLKTNAEFTHAVPEEPDVKADTYSIILRRSVTFKDIESEFLWGPRTRFPTYQNLKDYLASGTNVSDNNKSELIKLWGIENTCVVGSDHYTNYSTTTASRSLDK